MNNDEGNSELLATSSYEEISNIDQDIKTVINRKPSHVLYSRQSPSNQLQALSHKLIQGLS